MSDEEKKENPLDGIKQEMNRLLRQQWEKSFARMREQQGNPPAFSSAVEAQAQAILADSDIDREAAKLLLDHHRTERDAALDKKDFPAAARESAETTSHQQAVDALSKPKGHFTRQEFERKEAESVNREGGLNR